MEYFSKDDVLNLLNRNSITKKITLADGVSIYDSVKNLPTADVVPKSEVERLQDDNKFLQDRRFKEWSEVRQEVAREIFEEIDELLVQNATMQIATSTLHCKLAELKKKYTESEGKE